MTESMISASWPGFLTTPPGRDSYYPHFIDEETERLRGLEDFAQGPVASDGASIRFPPRGSLCALS